MNTRKTKIAESYLQTALSEKQARDKRKQGCAQTIVGLIGMSVMVYIFVQILFYGR